MPILALHGEHCCDTASLRQRLIQSAKRQSFVIYDDVRRLTDNLSRAGFAILARFLPSVLWAFPAGTCLSWRQHLRSRHSHNRSIPTFPTAPIGNLFGASHSPGIQQGIVREPVNTGHFDLHYVALTGSMTFT